MYSFHAGTTSDCCVTWHIRGAGAKRRELQMSICGIVAIIVVGFLGLMGLYGICSVVFTDDSKNSTINKNDDNNDKNKTKDTKSVSEINKKNTLDDSIRIKRRLNSPRGSAPEWNSPLTDPQE